LGRKCSLDQAPDSRVVIGNQYPTLRRWLIGGTLRCAMKKWHRLSIPHVKPMFRSLAHQKLKRQSSITAIAAPHSTSYCFIESTTIFGSRHQNGSSASLYNFSINDTAPNVFLRWQLVHHFQQYFFHNATEGTCTGTG